METFAQGEEIVLDRLHAKNESVPAGWLYAGHLRSKWDDFNELYNRKKQAVESEVPPLCVGWLRLGGRCVDCTVKWKLTTVVVSGGGQMSRLQEKIFAEDRAIAERVDQYAVEWEQKKPLDGT